MFRTLDYKTIIIIIIVIAFYLRLFMIRGRKRKQEQITQHKLRSQGKKIPGQKPNPFYRPRYQVTSWWLIGAAIVFLLFGITVGTSNLLPVLRPYDWLFVAAGGIMFIFCFK